MNGRMSAIGTKRTFQPQPRMLLLGQSGHKDLTPSRLLWPKTIEPDQRLTRVVPVAKCWTVLTGHLAYVG
jgi:hypothetical protein